MLIEQNQKKNIEIPKISIFNFILSIKILKTTIKEEEGKKKEC
jgi:hypothetical protein